MENKTAVMWLIAKIGTPNLINNNLLKLEDINKALEMEKDQLINAHLTGLIYTLEMEATKQATKYYSETYNKST